MTVADRVKRLRKELGITQIQLAETIGVAQNSIQKIESGITKQPRNINALARALNTTPEYLQFGIDANVSETNFTASRTFPLISWVAAGDFIEISEISITEAEYFPCPVSCSDQTFVLKIQGVSMEPQFTEGDLIFVDPLAEWTNKSFVVARLKDENTATFKQLIIEGDKKFLKALNPDWPTQLQPINGNCKIVGKVVFAGKSL